MLKKVKRETISEVESEISIMENLVSIIIVNWNGKKWLKSCLDSVYSQTYKKIEVILVDNGSSDESIDYAEKFYPKVKVIKNNSNLGFSKANNLGIKASRGDFLFLLNNDTILEEDTLGKLLMFKINNNFEIVGPKLLNEKREDIYNRRNLTIDFLGYLGWGSQTFYIDGCAFLISKNDYNELGGFDDKYFMYSEDIDLCWRAQLYGMKLAICEDATIIHFGGGSSLQTQFKKNIKFVTPLFRRFEVEKNNLMNLIKNYKLMNLLWVIPLFMIQSFFESIFYLVTGNFKAFKSILMAIYWNIINIRDTFKKRIIVQKSRKIGDYVMLKKMSFGINKLKALFIIGLPDFK
jgi:GT2 family glycosyltransferase